MIVFRACGMSLQYIVKVRHLCGKGFFSPYKSIPWDSVFGMRNFLSTETIQQDVMKGNRDTFLSDL